MAKIITVNGLIDSKKITGVYAHEHLNLNLFKIRKDQDSIIEDPILVTEELSYLKQYQVNLIVDLSNIVMGRNVDNLKKISDLSNINIVAATGLYIDTYLEDHAKYSIQELSEIFINEINQGIGPNKIKPGIIGEIGASKNGITDAEHKNIVASALASKATNLPIYTHSSLGKHGFDVASLLINNGVLPQKITIGHLDLNNDLIEIEKILKLGVFIGFDTIGKNEYNSNQNRINNLTKLLNKGYQDQILLSEDLTKKSHFKKYSGYGYDYLFTNFLPEIAERFGKKIIQKLLIDNPVRFLSI